MNTETFNDSITVLRSKPVESQVQIGPSKHCSNALAGAFALAQNVTINQPPELLDFQRYIKTYESLGSKVSRSLRVMTIDNSTLDKVEPDEELVKDVRASILLLSSTLIRTGRIEMPMPEGDWPKSRPTSSMLEVARQFGAEVEVKSGHISAILPNLERANRAIDVNGKVFATLGAMIMATGVGGITRIENPLSSIEVDNLAQFLTSLGADIRGLDSSRITIESDGMKSLDSDAQVDIAPDACETMFWIAYAKLHEMQLELVFPEWKQEVTPKEFGPLFDVRGLMHYAHLAIRGRGNVGIVDQQDIRQLEPIDIHTFHDKKGLPRDAATVLAVLFAVLDSYSTYHDDKYGSRRTLWMRELAKIGGDIRFPEPNGKAQIWGNKQWKFSPEADNTQLFGTDIRSAASLLLAATTSDNPVTVRGVSHIQRAYSKLPEKLSTLGTEILS